MCKINLNQELNGIELSFASKPDKATLDSIKAQGFRWNGKKCVWYAKQTSDRLTFAESLGEIETKTESKPNGINLDNLGENRPESFFMNGGLSKAIREELKKRGVKGCTVRQSSSGYTPSITITYKASEADFSSIEEAAERYTFVSFDGDIVYKNNGVYCGGRWLYFNEYDRMTQEEKEHEYYNYLSERIKKLDSFTGRYTWSTRNHYFELSAEGFLKLSSIFAIANQWNHDHSDSMTDYFDIGYYLDIDIKYPADFEPRATMTEEERTAYAEEVKKEEEEAEAERKRYEKEQEEQRKREEEQRKADELATELIYDSIIVEDLDEDEQLYITNCVGGVGKENSLSELIEDLNETYTEDCLIDRKVTFTNEKAYNEYINRFMYDFIFLAGKGGTGSNDARLEEVENIYSLNNKQRESIKWFCCHCVGIYFDDCLKMIINPEGHNYSRYVYLPTESSEEHNAAEVMTEQENESKTKTPFYFPKSIEDQAQALHEGQEVTIYQCDGWILNSITAGSGTVTGFYMGTWAQYSGLYIELMNGRKTKKVFIRDGRDCLIYEGIKDKLPEEITRRQISDNMYEMYNADVLIPNTYNYYKSIGELPIIDTCYR